MLYHVVSPAQNVKTQPYFLNIAKECLSLSSYKSPRALAATRPRKVAAFISLGQEMSAHKS